MSQPNCASPPTSTPAPLSRTWLPRLLLVLVLLPVVLGTALWWWAGRATSLEDTLRLLARWLPQGQHLHLTQTSGSLRHGGEIDQLHWCGPALCVQAMGIRAQWQADILHHSLRVQALEVAHLHVQPLQSPPAPDADRAAPPDLSLHLPLSALEIPLHIGRITWGPAYGNRTPAEAAPNTDTEAAAPPALHDLRDLHLHYRYSSSTHALHLRSLTHAHLQYSAQAQLQADGAQRLHVRLQAHTPHPIESTGQTAAMHLHALALLHGTLKGRDASLTLQARVRPSPADAPPPPLTDPANPTDFLTHIAPESATTADVPPDSVQLHARLHPWQTQPLHSLHAQLHALDLAQLLPQAPRTEISGHLRLTAPAPLRRPSRFLPRSTQTHHAEAPQAVIPSIPAAHDAASVETVPDLPQSINHAQQWHLQARLDNALPGPWDTGRLPLRTLRAHLLHDGDGLWHLPHAELHPGDAQDGHVRIRAHLKQRETATPQVLKTADTTNANKDASGSSIAPSGICSELQLHLHDLRPSAIWSALKGQPVLSGHIEAQQRAGAIPASPTNDTSRAGHTPPMPVHACPGGTNAAPTHWQFTANVLGNDSARQRTTALLQRLNLYGAWQAGAEQDAKRDVPSAAISAGASAGTSPHAASAAQLQLRNLTLLALGAELRAAALQWQAPPSIPHDGGTDGAPPASSMSAAGTVHIHDLQLRSPGLVLDVNGHAGPHTGAGHARLHMHNPAALAVWLDQAFNRLQILPLFPTSLHDQMVRLAAQTRAATVQGQMQAQMQWQGGWQHWMPAAVPLTASTAPSAAPRLHLDVRVPHLHYRQQARKSPTLPLALARLQDLHLQVQGTARSGRTQWQTQLQGTAQLQMQAATDESAPLHSLALHSRSHIVWQGRHASAVSPAGSAPSLHWQWQELGLLWQAGKGQAIWQAGLHPAQSGGRAPTLQLGHDSRHLEVDAARLHARLLPAGGAPSVQAAQQAAQHFPDPLASQTAADIPPHDSTHNTTPPAILQWQASTLYLIATGTHAKPADTGDALLPFGLRSRGQWSNLPLAWADILPGQPLTSAGIGGDLRFSGQWDIHTLQPQWHLRLNVERSAGDVHLCPGGTTFGRCAPPSPAATTASAAASQRLTITAATAQQQRRAQAAGLHTLALFVQAQAGQPLQARFQWNSQRLGDAQATLRSSVQRRADATLLWPRHATLEGHLTARVPDVAAFAWALPPGWQMGGSIRADMHVQGNRADPNLKGTLNGQALTLASQLHGIALVDGLLRARFDGQQIQLEELRLHGTPGNRARVLGPAGNLTAAPSEGGTLQASGHIRWKAAPSPAAGTPDTASTSAPATSPQMDLHIHAQSLQWLVRADRQISTSAELRARMQDGRPALQGRITIDRAALLLDDANVPRLDDDVVLNTARAPTTGSAADTPAPAGANALQQADLDLDIDLGPDFAVQGYGLITRLRGQLHAGHGGQLRGLVQPVQGRYRAWGQALDVESDSRIVFTGPYDDPSLDIRAVRANLPLRVGAHISGSARRPRVTLFSDDGLTDAEKLAWIVLGRDPTTGGAETAVLQQAALALLGGSRSGENFAGRLGLDEIGLGSTTSTDAETGEEAETAAITFGKRLGSGLYLSYEQSLSGALGTLYLLYDLSQRLTLRGQTGEISAIDLIYTRRGD